MAKDTSTALLNCMLRLCCFAIVARVASTACLKVPAVLVDHKRQLAIFRWGS